MPIRLVLLDNTVLTNFALVNRPDLVLGLRGINPATSPEVMVEYQAGVTTRGLPAGIIWNTLPELPLSAVEQAFADQLPPKLGRGERSCLAVTAHRHGLFACDDAEARREAQRLGVTVTGSIGILVLNVRQTRLTRAEANTLLAEMITQGYRSPVTTLEDLL